MRSIYTLEGRELPEDSIEGEGAEDEGPVYDIGEGTPLSSGGEEFEMPVDPDFADILGDILGDKK